MPLKTVESILEDTKNSNESAPIRTVNPETEAHSNQTIQFMDLLGNLERSTPENERILHPRDVQRQAAAIAGLPAFITDYMNEYAKLTKANNEFYGRHSNN